MNGSVKRLIYLNLILVIIFLIWFLMLPFFGELTLRERVLNKQFVYQDVNFDYLSSLTGKSRGQRMRDAKLALSGQ